MQKWPTVYEKALVEHIQRQIEKEFQSKINKRVHEMLEEKKSTLMKLNSFFWEKYDAKAAIKIMISTVAREHLPYYAEKN